MKISYSTLQQYFDDPIPSPEAVAELLTMHTFEIEGMEKYEGKAGTEGGEATAAHVDTILDVKVLPNRSHDCLSHRGIAREVSILSGVTITNDPLADEQVPIDPVSRKLTVTIAEPSRCTRYMAAVVENISVHESPTWLKEFLASIGQKSINNVVDATNYVMFHLGQPLHAYDADKLTVRDGMRAIEVRLAKVGELVTTLDNKEATLSSEYLVIGDAYADENVSALGIAGVKGGKRAEITSTTKNIVIEAAHFSASPIRRTSQQLRIRTDASQRFENDISPELAWYGLREVTALITDLAQTGTTDVEGLVDICAKKMRNPYKVGVSREEASKLLGVALSDDDMQRVLTQLGMPFEEVKHPAEQVIAQARTLVGVPYSEWTSISYDAPETFDCSSFTSYLYAQAGIGIPRLSVDQYVFGTPISKEALAPGDLVFANSGEGRVYYETQNFLKGTKVPEGVDHVALYLGDGMVAHAAKEPGAVVIEAMDSNPAFEKTVGYRHIPGNSSPRFVVTAPFERLDLRLKEDLIEEIGRLYSFLKIPSIVPEPLAALPEINKMRYYADKIRATLIREGFSEVYTYAMVNQGEVEIQNPIASDKKFLRRNLSSGVRQSLLLNTHNAPLLGLDDVRIFEIGSVFSLDSEYLSLALGFASARQPKKSVTLAEELFPQIEASLSTILELDPAVLKDLRISEGDICEYNFSKLLEKLPDLNLTPDLNLNTADTAVDSDPSAPSLSSLPQAPVFPPLDAVRYRTISPYPFILRDIAVFVPEGVGEEALRAIITEKAGSLLTRTTLFDVFTKTLPEGNKTSYAFRLVFLSFEKTLSDDEINTVMATVTEALNSQPGWQVR